MTQIISTIDFELEGKQVGWLRLPYSITRSAYGTIAIPIALISNGKGPRILLLAGNHGDEYEGQVVLTRLIKNLQPTEIKGKLFLETNVLKMLINELFEDEEIKGEAQ